MGAWLDFPGMDVESALKGVRGLPNRYLKSRDKDFQVHPCCYFSRVCGFEKEFERFLQIASRFLDGVALTGDIQFRTQRDIAVIFAFNDCGELAGMFHGNPSDR